MSVKGGTFVPIALLVWALAASLFGAYFYYLYSDLSQKTRKTVMHVNLGFNYGNGTVQWYNGTEATNGDTLLDVTLRVAQVSYITTSSGAIVNSINNLKNTNSKAWTWWAEQFGWNQGPTISDMYVLVDNETVYWCYKDVGATMYGGGAGQEKVTILSVTGFTNGTIKVNAKSVGGGEVEITDAVLKDVAGLVIEVKSGFSVKLPASGATNLFTISFTANRMTAGGYYTVTLVSKLGNAFVSSPFKAS